MKVELINHLHSGMRDLHKQYREATWRFRTLPDAIVIGAMKSGTTSLFNYLKQHPQLYPPRFKEVHYFDGGVSPGVSNYEKHLKWYKAKFPLKLEVGKHGKVYESTPFYIFHPLVPGRIFNLLPTAKLVAVLRNPSERAVSHYYHERRRGNEPFGILKALMCEEDRLCGVLSRKEYNSFEFIHYSYKSRGIYVNQLERYFRLFGRSSIYVTCSDRLFNNLDQELGAIFRFLGVAENCKINKVKPLNVAKNKKIISGTTRKYLNEFFEPYNRALYEMLGDNFNW